MSDRDELDGCLKEIETACKAYDAGDLSAGKKIARSLRAIFHQEVGSTAAPLISRQCGTYTKLASSVVKSPYPQGLYSPLMNFEIELAAVSQHVVSSSGNAGGVEPPSIKPRLGRADKFRQVQAPDWWKSEPVFLIDHSKVTRRDCVIWGSGAGPDGEPPSMVSAPLFPLLIKAKLTGLRGMAQGGFHQIVPIHEAHAAAARQIAHEVLHSPELKKPAR